MVGIQEVCKYATGFSMRPKSIVTLFRKAFHAFLRNTAETCSRLSCGTRSALDEQLVCVPDVADCRYDRSGQLAAELTAERVGVDLLLDLPAQPAADGTRLVLLLTHTFLRMRETCVLIFARKPSIVATVETGAVNVVVGQVRRFQIGCFAELIFVGPVILLTGRETVLPEQTGNLEALPGVEKCFTFSMQNARIPSGRRTKSGIFIRWLTRANSPLLARKWSCRAGPRWKCWCSRAVHRKCRQHHRSGGQWTGNRRSPPARTVLHQVIDMTERTIFRLGEIVLQVSLFA